MREAVIVSTARTPIGKAYRGAFNDRRETIFLCRKHLLRLRRAGDAGHEHRGVRYRPGFW